MGTTAAAAGAVARDWSAVPLDVLLIAMSSMEVPDVVHSGAVCSSWRSAYAAFRTLRLPTPRQPPCLLYFAAGDADGPATATLYSPSTNVTFRVPFQETACPSGVICSAHGWLFATDEAANPYFLNPLTGARATLPPITTLERVRSSIVVTDDGGGVVYDVDYDEGSGPKTRQITARRAREWMYRRVAVSGSPAAADGSGAAACVVLLVHMPYEELSFARPGDDRWTSLSDVTKPLYGGCSGAAYSDRDGLFYVVRAFGVVQALDLTGPGSPAARIFTCTIVSYAYKCTAYVVPMPSGGVLLATRRWRRSGEPPAGGDDEVDAKYVVTTDIQLQKMDVGTFTMERPRQRPAGPGDHALFLGRGAPLYLPTKGLPEPLSKPNCAYLTDDVDVGTFHSPMKRRDVGVWDFGRGSMEKLGEVWPLRPWLDSPAPIWFTPSLC